MARYRAFVSYNHGADGGIALALANALTRFARPWYRMRAMRVFLDRNAMTARPALWPAIEEALADADWLVLLASPGSAASPWVARELAWWLANRPRSRLVIARTGGEIVWDRSTGGSDFDWAASSALAPTLRGVYTEEPLWADLRDAAAARPMTVANPAFRDGFLTIAAELHGLSKDDLWSIERAEQRKRVGAALGASVLIAGFALGAYNQWAVSMDRKENLASIQLGAKAFLVLPSNPTLAAQLALAGVALRPSGIAAAALRSAAARLAPPVPARFEAGVPGAVDIALAADGGRLAVLAADGRVMVFDVAGGGGRGAGPVATLLPPRPFAAQALAWGAAGTLAAGGAEGLVVWPAGQTGLMVSGAPGRFSALPAVRGLAFDGDGRRLALAHADGSLRVVADPLAGATVQRLAGHAGGGARAVAFSADGRRLASGGDSGEATLWDLASGRALLRLALPRGVVSVDFNRHGSSVLAEQMLAVTDATGTVRVLDAGAVDGDGILYRLYMRYARRVAGRHRGAGDEAPVPARTITLPGADGRAAGVAARFVASGRCLARAGAGPRVEVRASLGFDRLFSLGDGSAGAPPTVALALAATRWFGVLDAAGRASVYEQPLCDDAEAVCRFAGDRAGLTAPLPRDERLRWIAPQEEAGSSVQQPPGCDCRQLIHRVLGGPACVPESRPAAGGAAATSGTALDGVPTIPR